MARAAIGWGVRELAESGRSPMTVTRRFERGETQRIDGWIDCSEPLRQPASSSRMGTNLASVSATQAHREVRQRVKSDDHGEGSRRQVDQGVAGEAVRTVVCIRT